MVEFGEQLRKAREDKGMTQQTLADKLFVTRPTVSRWERGERYPDLLTTKKITEILDVSLDNLLSGKDISIEVERNPVIENRTAHNAIIALYAFVIFSCMMVLFSNIANYFMMYGQPRVFGGPGGAEAELIGYASIVGMNFGTDQIIPTIKTIMQIVVFSFGLAQAIKETLSPKMTGGIIVLFLALESLVRFAEVLTTWITAWAIDVKFIIADFCIFLIPTVSGALLTYFLFIRNSKKIILPIMIIFVSVLEVVLNLDYTIYWIIYAIKESSVVYYVDEHVFNNIDFGMRNSFTINNVLVLLVDVAVYGLIVFQTVALWIKRKRVEEAIMKNAEGEVKETTT
ncbi:MAG: helix-turn-helix transcriptional regulator [Butyrivibrio sp.]|nr:helix-turn-helix transcriptional regulator [Butyrivibrio sp.]